MRIVFVEDDDADPPFVEVRDLEERRSGSRLALIRDSWRPVFRHNSVRNQVVDQSALIRRESRPMITLLLHLLRLLPFLCGGHRQLALENLALRQQLAIYQRTTNRLRLRRDGSMSPGAAFLRWSVG
jgi:hypothetical protein